MTRQRWGDQVAGISGTNGIDARCPAVLGHQLFSYFAAACHYSRMMMADLTLIALSFSIRRSVNFSFPVQAILLKWEILDSRG